MTKHFYSTDSNEHQINIGNMEDPSEVAAREESLRDWLFSDIDTYNDSIQEEMDYRAYEEDTLNNKDFR